MRQWLRELATVLNEGLDLAERHRPGGDAQPTDDGDQDKVQVAEEHHRWLNRAGEELRPERGVVQLVVALAECG